jgi:hypothetical protein
MGTDERTKEVSSELLELLSQLKTDKFIKPGEIHHRSMVKHILVVFTFAFPKFNIIMLCHWLSGLVFYRDTILPLPYFPPSVGNRVNNYSNHNICFQFSYCD